VVTLERIIPFKEAQKRIAEGDLLLVIPYHKSGMPTKLFEYMAFQKPILGLAEEDSDTMDVMKECGLAVSHPQDVPAMAEVIRGFLHQWESNSLRLPDASLQAMRRYHVDQQAVPVDAIMRSLIRQA
jgi:hypothetical protein